MDQTHLQLNHKNIFLEPCKYHLPKQEYKNLPETPDNLKNT